MLVTLKEILADAKERKYCVGAFNVPNLESVQAVIAAAEDLKVPVKFIGVGEGVDDLQPFDPDEFTAGLFAE